MENKTLIESYKFATLRDDCGIYAQRTLLRLVEAAQMWIEGLDFRSGKDIKRIEPMEKITEIVMPISAILPEGDKTNHGHAKKALKALQQKNFEYEIGDKWISFNFFSRVEFDQKKGDVLLQIQPELWRAFMDFSKGFRRFELEKAMSFTTAYSLRIYQLISGQTSPISYDLTELKKMLGIADKYPRPADFIKRVIIPAKQELDKISPYSFTFREILEKKGGKGRGKISGITFFPYEIRENADPKLVNQGVINQYQAGTFLTRDTINLLKEKLSFTEKMIKNNMQLLTKANKGMDLAGFIRRITPKATRAKNPQGYFINALKSECDFQGIIID